MERGRKEGGSIATWHSCELVTRRTHTSLCPPPFPQPQREKRAGGHDGARHGSYEPQRGKHTCGVAHT